MLEIRMNTPLVGEAAKYWGDKVPMMAMEEMAELTKAVSKLERSNDRYDVKLIDAVEEEIRDVFIAMGMLMYRYGITAPDVCDQIEAKLNKKY